MKENQDLNEIVKNIQKDIYVYTIPIIKKAIADGFVVDTPENQCKLVDLVFDAFEAGSNVTFNAIRDARS